MSLKYQSNNQRCKYLTILPCQIYKGYFPSFIFTANMHTDELNLKPLCPLMSVFDSVIHEEKLHWA